MNSGQPQTPSERVRPTLQLKIKAKSWNELRPTLRLKIKANSWNELRPIPPERLRPTLGTLEFRPTDPPERLRLALQLKIKANSWNEFRSTPPRKIKANSSTEN